MPRFSIQPLIKLSKEQYKVLLERIMSKEGRTAKAIESIMNRPFEPPVEKEVGALFKRRALGGGEFEEAVERLPIEEARAKYLTAPEEYVAPSMQVGPPAKVMRAVEPGSSEELASGLAYERIKERPIIPPVGRTARVMQQEVKSQELEAAVGRLGVRPEDIRPGVKLETIIEEAGRKPKDMITVPPAAELANYAKDADEMWRNLTGQAGERSLGAKVWEGFRSSSRQVSHIHSARDYFISSFVRWKQNPVKFTKTYSREARILNQLESERLTALQPQPTAIPGTNLPGRAGGGVLQGGVD